MSIDDLIAKGLIGGRTAQIVASGSVEAADYALPPLEAGWVRLRTVRTAISPGTEMTFLGRDASNVYLHKHWDEELRLFQDGAPSISYPIPFGYRAVGKVVETRSPDVEIGLRVFGNWPHTVDDDARLPGHRPDTPGHAHVGRRRRRRPDGADLRERGRVR